MAGGLMKRAAELSAQAQSLVSRRGARKSGRPLRLAYLRVAQETNALSVLETVEADFRRTHYLEGSALGKACQPLAAEAQGFVRNAELSGFVQAARRMGGVETVPLFSAWAVPGGPLSAECFEMFRARIVDAIRGAGPLDGLYFCLHGAMGARGVVDPESRLLEAAQAALGAGKPIAVTHDLHANLTVDRVAASPLLLGYRTNPHRDHRRIGARAGELLVRTLRGEVRPVAAWRSLPMYLGGGTTLDFLPPMRAIFQRMREMERDPRVLAASVYMSHPWNDHPELGWSTHVITDGDPDLGEALAEELADMAWGVKDQQPPRFPDASEAIATARAAKLARRTGAVVLSDASDVVSAGSIGENTRLLDALLREGEGLLSYVPIRDAEVVAKVWSLPIGATVRVEVGGKIDPTRDTPIPVEGRLVRKDATSPFGDVVVLDLGHVQLVVTAGQPLAIKPAFYTDRGLDPWKADIVVVKNFFPFRLYFAPLARKTLYVRTRGLTDLDAVNELEFPRPLHPRDPVAHWRPTDRARRGLIV